MQQLETKQVPVSLKETDRDKGTATFVASVFGVKDHSGDVVLPGAFTDSLAQRAPKFIADHDWSVRSRLGKVMSARETSEGLEVKVAFNLSKQVAREVYSDFLFDGAGQEFSFGYVVPEGGAEFKEGTRYLKRVELFEVSPVLIGDNPSTHLIDVKGSAVPVTLTPEQLEEARAQLTEMKARQGERTLEPDRIQVKDNGSGPRIKAEREDSPEYKEAFSAYLKSGVWTRDLEVKAQSEGTTSAGGAVTPNDFYSRLVVFLADAAPMLGASRVIDSDGFKIDLPRLSAHGSAAWTAEAAAYAESDETFATLTVQIFKATRLVKVSEELVADSGVDLEGYLAEEFGRSLGALVNTALTVGTGSAQPFGVVPQVPAGNIVTYPAGNSTSILSADRIFDVFYKLPPQSRNRAVWMMNDSTALNIATLKDTTNRYIWQNGLTEGQPPTLLGRPVITNPDIVVQAANAKSLLFGDLSGFFVARRPSVQIRRLDERYSDTGQIGYVGNFRVGSDLADTKAVVLGKNSAT